MPAGQYPTGSDFCNAIAETRYMPVIIIENKMIVLNISNQHLTDKICTAETMSFAHPSSPSSPLSRTW